MNRLELPRVDRSAQLVASALAQQLRSADLRTQAATAWARAIEASVAVRDAGIDASPAHGSACFATAGLRLPDGRVACLKVSTHLLAGLMGALAGAAPKPIGPTPLSPAEEGLFAFLVLQWTALLADPLALDWVDGGAELIPTPDSDCAITWHVSVADQTGVARWLLPADLPPPRASATERPDLPITAHLSAGGARWGGHLAPGDLVVLVTPATVRVGPRSWPARWCAGAWQIAAMKEVQVPDSLNELPVTLDASVGAITLTVGEVARLAPGVVLPIANDAAPIITLLAGGRPIAQGVLVEDDGRIAVQVTQILAAG